MGHHYQSIDERNGGIEKVLSGPGNLASSSPYLAEFAGDRLIHDKNWHIFEEGEQLD